MKGKLTITVGISGSGKSSWAQEEWAANSSRVVIVNRDKIRELLFGFTERSIVNYYNLDGLRNHEKEVTKYETLMIKEGLNDGKHVIVDATHLRREYISRFKFFNVPTELKFFPMDLPTALVRNAARERSVGEDVIKRQCNQYDSIVASLKDKPVDFTPVKIELNPHLPPAFIWDVDGTIAHMKDRSPYDWKRVGEDDVDNNLWRVYAYMKQYSLTKPIICTGRDGVCEEETKKWLFENGFNFDEFYIREAGDMRPDWVVKEEMWREIAKSYNIVALFDDRCQVVDRARSLGLKVLQVEYHNF